MLIYKNLRTLVEQGSGYVHLVPPVCVCVGGALAGVDEMVDENAISI